jgi:ribonuclease PH
VARPDGRAPGELRAVTLERGASPFAEGSCLVRFGATLVMCTASILETVPPWRRGGGRGWLTAEYAMLPRATQERTGRERNGPGGRTQEIQRLIGRSLRGTLTGFDFGERTIQVDCDVLQADGGTRTAAITGAALAVHDACRWMAETRGVANPFARLVAGVSVGIVGGEPVLDLCYAEDRVAEVDANVVVLEPDRYVEVQATGESGHFGRAELDRMLATAGRGIEALFALQHAALG